jgi:hypothetical protein
MALQAHSSQIADSTAAKIPHDLWPEVFGIEDHIRVHDATKAPTPEDDLFAGISELGW